MLSWLRNRIEPIDLEFTLDIDDRGEHIIEVYVSVDGRREKVKDVRKLWNYGYTYECNKKRYTISIKSLEILLSIRSLNPTVDEDGKIISEVCPPVLCYLRTHDCVKESLQAKKLEISSKPLKPVAKIDYKPDVGLIVETGYYLEGKEDDIIALRNLNITLYSGYVRCNNTFSLFLKR